LSTNILNCSSSELESICGEGSDAEHEISNRALPAEAERLQRLSMESPRAAATTDAHSALPACTSGSPLATTPLESEAGSPPQAALDTPRQIVENAQPRNCPKQAAINGLPDALANCSRASERQEKIRRLPHLGIVQLPQKSLTEHTIEEKRQEALALGRRRAKTLPR